LVQVIIVREIRPVGAAFEILSALSKVS